MEERRPYPSDVTDAQWAILEPLIARPRRADGRGRPPEVELREVCRWRALPHDFPNFNTVYWYFAKWTDDGTLVRIHDALRRRTREHSGREPDPSALIIDSQSVKATEKGGCRLRRRHAGEGDEALHRRRYERAAAAGGRLECEGAGLGWPAGPVRGGAAGQPARDRRLGRRRLRRRRGRGTGALRVGARGRAEADRPARLRRPAASLGGGAHVRLADRLPPAHQGLRSLRRDERGFHLSGDDPPHAPPPRPRRRPTTLEDRSRRLIHSQTRSKDWRSGLGLSLTTYQRSHYINFHHIFPRSVLLKAGYDSIEANEIANMAFISGRLNRSLGDRMPDEYFPGIVDGRGQQVLASQQIPLHPDLWK